MRVPDEAGPGIAKLTFSFDSWEAGEVSHSMIEIPISEQEDEPETAGG
ncbi:MAG TPA: hypothetical protein VGH74_03720 [Planctomycetaceae bacterium]